MLNNTMKIGIACRTYPWQSCASPPGPCFFQEAPAGWQCGIFPRTIDPVKPSENRESGPLMVQSVHAVTMQTHVVSRRCEWVQPNISPHHVFWYPLRDPISAAQFADCWPLWLYLCFWWHNIQIPQLWKVHSVPLLTLGDANLFPS